MKETFYERIGEAVCRERLTNGLEVCVVPKPGYAKKYAFFSTRYGGMDTRFCLDGQWLNTPAGIAHYLEHKMFDTREGNALQEPTISIPRSILRKTCGSCCPLCPFPISPTRALPRSRASSVRRSA